MAPILKKPIFVGGLNKSGTSLMNLVLSKHSALSGVEPELKWEEKKKGKAALFLMNHDLVEGHKLTGLPEKLKPFRETNHFASPTTLSKHWLTEKDVENDDAEMIASTFSAAMVNPDLRLIEKSPPTLVRTRYFQDIFQDCSFIIMVRNPYANVVANAIKRKRWGSIEDQCLHWNGGYNTFYKDQPLLKRSLVVHYESLVMQPEEELRRVCNFLEIDYDPLMLEGYEIQTSLNQSDFDLLLPETLNTMVRFLDPALLSRLNYTQAPTV